MEKNLKQENISFSKGIRRTPTTGESGELSECVNLMPKDGEMVNIPVVYQLSDNKTVTAGRKLVYIHEKSGTYGYKNYITSDTSGTYLEGVETLVSLACISVTSVGNTLCVSTSDGVYYFLWKAGAYIHLGNHLPEVKLSFGLTGDYYRYRNADLDLVIPKKTDTRSKGCKVEDDNFTFIEDEETGMEVLTTVSDLVNGSINEFETKAQKLGRFFYPFFARFAVRMYDGTRTMESSPCLMIPTMDASPVVALVVSAALGDDDNYNLACYVEEFAAHLTVHISNTEELENWEDIIDGVEVYASQQHQRYMESKILQSRVVTRYTGHGPGTAHCADTPVPIKSIAYRESSSDGPIDTRSKIDGSLIFTYDDDYYTPDSCAGFNASSITGPVITKGIVRTSFSTVIGEPSLKYKESGEYEEELKSENSYFLLQSIPLSGLSKYSQRSVLKVKEGHVYEPEAYDNFPVIASYSHDKFKAEQVTSYNSRLLLSGTSRVLTNDIPLETSIGYITGDNVSNIRAYVKLTYYGVDYYVKQTSGLSLSADGGITYFYYPDPHAVEAYLFGDGFSARIDLTTHDLLNGSYWFGALTNGCITPLSTQDGLVESEISALVSAAEIDRKDTLMVSETANPFVFKEASSVTLPSRILGVSPTAKALSQGQFGQFPLYAFCDDGIWALTVANTGSFSASQPVSRDRVSNVNSITQVDGAVLFVTKQGLKIIQGSETKLLSGRLDGLNLAETYFTASIPESLRYDDVDEISDYMQTATLVYDYANQLVHAFKPDCKMHYVYSLETGEFSKQMLSGKLLASVPGYPTSTMQMDDNKLYEYRKQTSTSTTNGYLITRPCYLGNPMARKALMQIKTLGFKTNQNSSFSIAVYVSNNLRQWTRLSSLKGMSALYYRFVVKTTMLDVDALSGMTVLYQERYLNKLI